VTILKRFSRIALTLLLSASVLVWGIVPPAIRHAHEGGGKRDHRHDAAARHDLKSHHHHHRDGADHPHEHEHVAEPTALGDFVVHLHWTLFGLDFSVPASQQGENDEEDGASRLALIRLVDELPAVAPGGPDSPGVSLVTPPLPGTELVAVETSPSHAPHSVASIPLCDSARLERSGVLLA
jgi:hypothetical protein